MSGDLLRLKAFPYDGSQDSTKHPLLIDAKDIVESDNIVYTTYSTKRKRPGITRAFPKKPSGSNGYLAGFDFFRAGTQYVVLYDGRSIKVVNPSTGLEDIISSGVDIPFNAPVHFLAFSGLLIIFFDDGGVTAPKKWTGSGMISDLSSSAPKAPFGQIFLNCLWLPDPSVPGRVIKSDTGNPTNFTSGTAATYDLDVNDGDPDGVTAMMPPLWGNFYISKRLGIYKIEPRYSGTTLFFAQSKIVDNLGAIGHSAVVQAEGTNFFASDRGMHYLENSDKVVGIETKFPSLPIQNDWRSQINFNRAKYSKMVYDLDSSSILFLYPKQGRNFNSDLWGFSLSTGKWYQWQSFEQTSMFRYIERGTKRIRTMVCSSDGEVGYLDLDSNTDYGEKIEIYFRSGLISPSDTPGETFQLDNITAVFVPQEYGSFDITYKVDGITVDTLTYDMTKSFDFGALQVDFVLGQTPLGSLPQVICDTKSASASGMFFEFIVYHSPNDGEEDTNFELLGLILDISSTGKSHGRTAG